MKKIIPVLAALVLACTACTEEILEQPAVSKEEQSLMTKLVGGSQGEIKPGNILVKLDTKTTEKILEGRFAEVSEGLFGDLAVKSFSPAIPVRPKNIAVAKKYGLDRWFTVEFDEEIRPETAARTLAASSSVRSVQYNKHTEPVESQMVYPFEPKPATKASAQVEGIPFNDKYASYQWNLYNDGTINPAAVAGADVNVKDAWRLTGGDPSVVVAVFDCGLQYRHEDLKEAMWTNEAELNGQDGVDDDGNGFIDDKYGFNFVNCFAINADYTNGLLEGKKQPAVSGNPLNSTDGYGHGTHVAGIVAATNGNGKGISSIAGGTGIGDGVRLMSCQIFQGNAYSVDAQTAAAYIYAADNGACIAQCSYGNRHIITSDDIYLNGDLELDIDGAPLENAALRYFLDPANSNHESLEGNIAVFASGNFGNPYSIYPGALPYVISVSAIGYDFLPGGYANYGPGVKISAPGGEFKSENELEAMILSTGVAGCASPSPGVGGSKNYVYMQGTSMACPHVSGVLALGISYAKKLGKTFTREEMTSLLLTSVNDLDQYLASGSKKFAQYNEKEYKYEYIDIPLNQYYGKVGTGTVDAWKFLMAIEGTPSVIVEANETASIDLSDYCNPSDEYTISVDEASRTSLGLTADPVIKDGKLEISCSKVGAGKVTVMGAVGKDPDKTDGIGNMNYSREISIISREFATENGGWL